MKAPSLCGWRQDSRPVVNITDKHAAYATEVAEHLQAAGFRAETDLRNEKIGFKIRELELAKVPYVVVVGDKEMASGRSRSVRGTVKTWGLSPKTRC